MQHSPATSERTLCGREIKLLQLRVLELLLLLFGEGPPELHELGVGRRRLTRRLEELLDLDDRVQRLIPVYDSPTKRFVRSYP